ncbi:uncharacterized protein PV06_08735 [Exophiala oligosperma]|uniref:Uncharacterized protein n=1 Tax=Exophiala oligosperma TaxID=215243 RepID=A0A0D2BN38_9EURO|nr:uncharacterized protein PV06_08735 [Exophiala oligosperma]KIW38912.1 hypothetical protein PV06_08735 [Exophiala oligosperma]
MPRRREGGDLCAIFIHAGAGFHSRQNEKSHLAAVNDAALVAMAILKNGGNATDAVEMAIRLLEDKEITNAGYGSNLTMDGIVECDATMVDHMGRSGAVGAMSQVKNPIAAARLVLDESIKPLSLQRVPPNLLVGAGATDFAHDKGLPILPPDFLVSNNARDRWLRWKRDLQDVEDRSAMNQSPEQRVGGRLLSISPKSSRASATTQTPSLERRPSLPSHSTFIEPDQDVPTSVKALASSRADDEAGGMRSSRRAIPRSEIEDDNDSGVDDSLQWLASPPKRQKLSGRFDGLTDGQKVLPTSGPCPTTGEHDDGDAGREDDITDTVGAIAIDCFGRLAAGSSSGGIGMKHKGRCGPAALVGVGTAVIPVDPEDISHTAVATVTSGTGEHMATTTAAATAAERVYSSMRKKDGRLERCNEDEALYAMITREFMQHPGVVNSPCLGAIGILAVKKTRDGIYFYFGHNTDSFALASMHSEERKPVCTMSRSRGNGSVAQGGRVARSWMP